MRLWPRERRTGRKAGRRASGGATSGVGVPDGSLAEVVETPAAAQRRRPRILVMAGGTGGHVFPALAVAELLRAHGVEVHWLGTRRGLERSVVGDANIPLHWLTIRGLRGKGAMGWLAVPWRLRKAMKQAREVFRHLHPDAVLGMGGFVSGPGGLVARRTRTPLVIHEQNAVAGLTNRVLARFADRVLEAFPGTFEDARGAVCVGNPVRSDIAALQEPSQRLLHHHGPLRLLVLGGSQGARALNRLVPRAVLTLSKAERPRVRHQAGRLHADLAKEWYRQAGIDARVDPFIENMAEAYGWADLVLCRAGALTIAELTAAGIGAILVPYPYAVDDHQTANAEFMVAAGAARLVAEDALTPELLAGWLRELDRDRGKLLAMARAAREQARPNATRIVAATLLRAGGFGTEARPTGKAEEGIDA